MGTVLRDRYATFVVADREGDSFVFVSQFPLFRIKGVAIRAEGATRVQFFVGNDADKRNPNGQRLPISPFLAAHDVMRRTGSFPEPGNFYFKPLTLGMSVAAVIPGAPVYTEVIFWGDVVE